MVTVEGAAEMIGCTPSTVRTQISKGRLAVLKTSGDARTNYVTVASVKAYIRDYRGKVGKYSRKLKETED